VTSLATPELTPVPEEGLDHDCLAWAEAAFANAHLHGSALIGREAELSRLTEALRAHRVVTVTGPGGVGKTSLAMAALQDGQPHGQPGRTVVVCELAEVLTGEAVRPAVAARLGVQPLPGQPVRRTLLEAADGSELVVLLDNCEHVLEAAAEIADDLAAAGPHVRVLATSREPLGLPPEQVLPLRPLEVPATADDPRAVDSPAVALFARRAAASSGSFRIDDTSLPYVARICRALDGLPLALEIAAARVRSMSVRDIAHRLERPWSVLRSSSRRAPQRHRSLRAVFDWSWDLLDAAERRLLTALAVYPGGADLAAATAAGTSAGIAADDVLDVLDSLVAKSLLSLRNTHDRTRYVMPETLRAYGVERLDHSGALAEARNSHASYYASMAGEARRRCLRAWRSESFSAFVVDFDNMRAALTWTLAHDEGPDRSFELLAPLWFFCHLQGEEEVVALTDRALARWPQPDHPLWSEVAATAAEAAVGVDEIAVYARRARQAIEAATSPVGVAHGWRSLAEISAFLDGDCATAMQHLDRAVRAAREAGYHPLLCELVSLRAQVLGQAGHGRDALAAAEEALELARRQGNQIVEVWSRQLLGMALATEEPEAARSWLSAAQEGADALGTPYLTGSAVRGLATLAAAEGDVSTAARLFVDACDRFTMIGCQVERWTTVAAMLPLLLRAGRRETAGLLLRSLDHGDVVVKQMQAPDLAQARRELAGWADGSSTRLSTVRLGDLLALARAEAITIARKATDHQPPVDAGGAQRGSGELVRRGDLWSVTYACVEAHLPNLKGVHDLAALLAQPGRELAALDLASGPGIPGPRTPAPEGFGGSGDLGEQLDATARAAYKARIQQLQDELDSADAAGDAERAARAQEEMDFIARELSAAYGLRGPRRTGDPAEKARAAVTGRIRAAIVKIGAAHPALGRHLAASVRTGRFCSYQPAEAITWTVRR
jgi:predicted ATPase